MSVWKKASKINQKTHRERHQPESRQHLGLLEKKKDYKKRADDYNEKKETLKLLKKRALNKNPDEFYYHMINSKIDDGRHFEKEKETEDTPEQVKLMQSQDLKYITMKRTQERKKIDKLQSQLHLTSVEHDVKNKHIYFDNKKKQTSLNNNKLINISTADLNLLAETTSKRTHLYNELNKRIEREKQLAIVQEKLQMAQYLTNKKELLPPKRVKKGNKDRAPVYKWPYERKK